MHSSYETAGCADVEHMVRALTSLYSRSIVMRADGALTIG